MDEEHAKLSVVTSKSCNSTVLFTASVSPRRNPVRPADNSRIPNAQLQSPVVHYNPKVLFSSPFPFKSKPRMNGETENEVPWNCTCDLRRICHAVPEVPDN